MSDTEYTVLILLVGVSVVVGGILALRLHAFLALVLGAFAVGLMTTPHMAESFLLEKSGRRIVDIAAPRELTLRGGNELRQGEPVSVLREEDGEWIVLSEHLVDGKPQEDIVTLTPAHRADDARAMAGGDLVVPTGGYYAAISEANADVPSIVAAAFGSMAGKIGILIAMAAIIGKCLLESGAADRIVRTLLGWTGERGAPAAFLSSGFLLGIPVFFDTVFYLMIPLGKAMRLRTGRNYLLYVLTIVCGATMAHSLVPPTPGPLYVATELNVDLATMIIAGGIVGLFAAAFGYLYATIAARIWDLPLRDSADAPLAELERSVNRSMDDLPPFWLSLLPILLPVVLIASEPLYQAIAAEPIPTEPDRVRDVVDFLSDKNVALILSAAIALVTVIWQNRTSLRTLAESVGQALAGGGVIILITAAGGAFGAMLQRTGVSHLFGDVSGTSGAALVTIAFLITAAVRTAQGSATVAMLTAVGIVGGLATSGNLGFHPVYLALAIGCGSKPVAWMNDSGFWVITKMSGMTELEGLKFVTPMTTCMGIVGLLVTIAGVILFPMAG